MDELIVPALVGFFVGLPALVFSVVQWSKSWNRENRQIAENGMEAALREGQSVLQERLAFEKEKRREAEQEKYELEREIANLRAELIALDQRGD